ncbi:MAG: hypothetical protein H6832_10950 [Planctomycetes bacterium]|nr:hypothetical protein [Planctomycetota bacterium]MCB9891140.1 hypothetical protein [Planctomycetota bacterium]MCB9918907.1 hypothetical protein [Planctomycetota bacterium]
MTGFTIQLVSEAGAETDALRAALSTRLELAWAEKLPEALEEVELLWVHAGPGENGPALGKTAAQLLRAWVLGGGRLLLTGAPAAWVGPLGFEASPPEVRSRTWQGPLRTHDRLGIAPYVDHPLFERFPGGVYLRRPAGACHVGGAFWSRGTRPRGGRLIGVEKVFLAVQAETGLLVEYTPGTGRILALGAHLVFEDARPSEDPFAESRVRFAADLCEFLVFGEENADSAWPELGRDPILEPRSFEPDAESIDPAVFVVRVDESEWQDVNELDGFELTDRCGRLLLADSRGVREVWDLPSRVFGEFRLSDDRGNVLGSNGASVRIANSAVERRFDGLCETWGEADDGFVWELEVRGTEGLDAAREGDEGGALDRLVRVEFRSDMRLQWPYPAGVTRPHVATSNGDRMLRLRDDEGRRGARLAFSRTPERVRLQRAGRGNGVVCEVEFVLGPRERVSARLTFDAPRESRILVSPTAPRPRTELDTKLRRRIERAKLAVDRAFVDVAPLSHGRSQAFGGLARSRRFRGYVAGLDTSRPGWCDGRPGPSWLFARDAYWTIRSMLPWTGPDRALATLQTMAAFQDARGGIPHEITTAGVAHYDATDATPLFVDAVVRFVEHHEDEGAAIGFWPHVERALAWVLESDRDGDCLLENGRGHGFVEDGPLAASIHVELGVVCAQYAGLAAGARLAQRLGKDVRAGEWQAASSRIAEIVHAHFLDLDTGGFASFMRSDGNFVRRATALGILPFVFGLATDNADVEGLDLASATAILDGYAEERFARPEGLRFVPTDDVDYVRDGYQYGACWPLLGALLALAEAGVGLEDRAKSRLERLATVMAADGAMPEIVDGDDGSKIGVCRHHATASAVWLGAVAELWFEPNSLPTTRVADDYASE